MAAIHPPIRTLRPMTAGEHLEVELLEKLEDGLPDGYVVFHSVDWRQSGADGDRVGEADIVVVNGAGDVAILEVKAGELTVRDGVLTKRYGGVEKDVGRQTRRQHATLLSKLREHGLHVRVLLFLVLPHQRIGDEASLAYQRDRILDSDDCTDLPGAIAQRLGMGLVDDEVNERVRAFIGNRLATILDVGALDRRLQSVQREQAAGLADWVMRLQVPSGVVRVIGTAGSGKTQLALRRLNEARARGQRAAYVCFNRPLADHVRSMVPSGVTVGTFHQWCWIEAGRPTGMPDFDALVASFTVRDPQSHELFDVLVIDELQDFKAQWVSALIARLRDDGSLLLLDDPSQVLYDDREEIEVPDAVVVTCDDNHRSPRSVVQIVNMLGLVPRPVIARCPFDGEWPGFSTWDSQASLADATLAAVQSCLKLGYHVGDIVVVTWRGVGHGALQGDSLGPYSLSRFSGRYDEHGEPVWTDGDLKLETLRRIKGQSSAAIVLTEIDFDAFNDRVRRQLFVGMSRARMHLELVMSHRAERLLTAELT